MMSSEKNNLLSVLAVFLMAVTAPCYAQEPVLRHYTPESGLPSSETYCVIQDRKGYMWFGTDKGLSRFNGYEFKTFSTADGLADNTIFGLYEDHEGRIWYHSYSGRTGYMHNDSSHQYVYNSVLKPYLRSSILKGIVCAGNGDILVATSQFDSVKIFRTDSHGSVRVYSAGGAYKDIYLSEGGACMGAGRYTRDSVRIISIENGRVIKTFKRTGVEKREPFACRTMDGSRFIFNAGEIWLLKGDTLRSLFKMDEEVLSIAADDKHNVWLGTLNNGVLCYEAETAYRTSKRILHKYSVSGVTTDWEGGVWFTTLESGVYYLPPLAISSYTENKGLPVPKVMRVENVDGNMAMVFSNSKVAMKFKDSPVLTISENQALLPPVYDLNYIPEYDRVYLTGFGVRSSVPFPFGHKTVYLDGMKYVHKGRSNIWGLHNAHLVKYDREGHSLKNISFDHLARLTSVFEKNDSELLVGTLDGLLLYNLNTGNITPLKQKHPLFSCRVAAISRFGNRHLVMATMGQGLLILKDDDYEHPQQYTLRNGLPAMMCSALLCDGDSVLWVGTNKGLCRITDILEPGAAEVYVIDMNDGIVSDEINDLCILDKELWVATMKGVSVIPRSMPPKTTAAIPLYIEAVEIAGKLFDPTKSHSFTYDQNTISISFSGISYQYAGQLLYHYRLRGVDERWNTSASRTVIYSVLKPGTYTFELRVTGPNGIDGGSVLAYSFEILPPFWQTWWFIAVFMVTAGFSLYLLVRYRVKVIKAQARLRSDLDSFRDKALRAQMNPHFIYNSMNAIQNYIRKSELSASSDFLSKFSKLMRLTFNNSGAEMVPLQKDLEALMLYTDMEKMRFPDKFNIDLSIDTSMKAEQVMLPPLLIQPFVENAILHGFNTKAGKGNIRVTVRQIAGMLEVTIKDDGIGRMKATEINMRKNKYGMQEQRRDSGISITQSRIRQAWGRRAFDGMYSIIDLYDNHTQQASGTLVIFYLPIHML